MNDKPDDRVFTTGMPDVERLANNIGQFVEQAGKVTAAYLKPLEAGRNPPGVAEEVADVVKSIGHVAESWLSDPQRALEAQTRLTSGYLTLWSHALHRFNGEAVPAVMPSDPRDQRFKDPEWRENPFFDFLRQAYLLTTNWATDMVQEAEGIDDHTRQKAQFYVRQLSGALSPSNFIATNPELLRETLKQDGENLVRGMKMLAEDIEAGGGELKLRQSDTSKFEVGVNIATTPGAVIFRNDLIELIQYAPRTETVLKRPLLIVPPWINKFYVLDLNAEKSFIKWAVDQGLTVFCVSWVNPDERHRDKGFDAYMTDGIFAALDAIRDATGETKVTAIGYCVGGTLLSASLGYMAAKKDKRIDSATLFTTQVDFEKAGDLNVFVDEPQIRALEAKMAVNGYLEGRSMASAFNMLRPNDLIWPYMVNVYLKGQSPFAFDLLFWNADSTRMPEANHSFYLRNCYLENNLSQGKMTLNGVRIDLGKVKVPIYNLAAREDHIAPAASVFAGCAFFGGDVRYVLSGSGHIAGVVNPPAKGKYQYWLDGPATGTLTDWISRATEHPGSWWPDWFAWIEAQAPKRVPARQPGDGALPPICPAPGTYVRVMA